MTDVIPTEHEKAPAKRPRLGKGVDRRKAPRLDPEERRRLELAQKKYGRGQRVATSRVKDKKLRANLRAVERKYRDAAVKARDAEILLENSSGYLEPESELERTYKVRQEDLVHDTAIETATKGFELKLEDFGPYVAEYTRNGRDLLLMGRKGHVATMDWREGKLSCELQLGETTRDAKWLHNNQYFAVAQKQYVYIYDHAGVELHCLKKLVEVSHMEFLPYHFLLATIVSSCQDVEGRLVAFQRMYGLSMRTFRD
jgi:U3 small nucleolar RNA-associated protein 7